MLQVLPALDSGGVERGTLEVAEALVRGGLRAIVASAGGRLVRDLEGLGARHVTLPLRAKDPITLWRNAGRLASLIVRHRVAVIHARSRAPAWSARLAAQRTGARWVTTYHGVYGEGFPGKRLYNAVMASGERVIAISRFVAEHVVARHGTDPHRIRIIPRGVDPRLFDPACVAPDRTARLRAAWGVPEHAPLVLFPGRLSRWKGQQVLIQALALMTRSDTFAVFAGDAGGSGGHARHLARLAAAAGLRDRIRFTGHVADMPAALAAADVVVSASIRPEAFGRVVIEAQAMARPVVATAHGGAAETVEDGATGLLVPPNDPAALASALDRLLALPADERRALGDRARRTVLTRYSSAHMTQATLAVYRELLAETESE